MTASLQGMATRLLGHLDAERAHAAAIGLLRVAPLPRAPVDDPALAVEAFGLRFSNPVGMAAGFDKDALVFRQTLKLGFGFTEVGTVTPQPQPGNPRPRVFRLAVDGAIINRYGFNNQGQAAAHRRLAARARTGVVGVNVGANKATADRAADYAAGILQMADVADFFVLNVSSPNTPGLRDLQSAAALDSLLGRAIEARDRAAERHGRRPLLLKIAPDLDEAATDEIVGIARARQIDGMIVANTTTARPADLRDAATARQSGGLSGRPLFGLSTRMLAQVFVRAERQFPVIGVGGIDSPERALLKIQAGATLIELYSGLIFRGPALLRDIKTGLADHLRRESTSLPALIGSAAAEIAARGVDDKT